MGLISGLFGLPLAPLRATVWVAEQVGAEAERRARDPAVVRARLEEVAEARAAGTITAEEAARTERRLVAQLMQGRRGSGERG
jgi:hypothetical protein